MSNNILKDFVCKHPFEYMDVTHDGDYVCCPSWCPTNIRPKEGINFNSDTAKEIRKSVLDGSYKFCDHKICPSLSLLKKTKTKPYNFYTRKEFDKKYNIKSIEDIDNLEVYPEEILFGWDRSCNFKCPSCRVDLIPNAKVNSPYHKSKLKILEHIENKLGKGIKKILVTGSGDPFYSKIYRDFLINFNKDKFPNIENIQIITNGKMVNKKMWSQLNAAPYVKQMEISIDAGTKNTYENITRLGGNWDTLIDNLHFVKTIDSLDELIVSMVVSKHNYKEMVTFHNLIYDIFDKAPFWVSINYRQHVHWGTGKYTEEETKALQIFEPSHPEHEKFMAELGKLNKIIWSSLDENGHPTTGNVFAGHNFHHLTNE